MCGRFTLTATAEEITAEYQLTELSPISPRYNIAPSQPILAIYQTNGRMETNYFNWGLIPSWTKDPKIGYKMINARSETVATKPSFRAAYKYRRCLIPMNGFYEWQAAATKSKKQPYLIQRADEQLFTVAGLWESWHSSDGSQIDSCTLLTTRPNELMEPLHNRMPVILHPDDYQSWLDCTTPPSSQLQHLFHPYSPDQFTAFPVTNERFKRGAP